MTDNRKLRILMLYDDGSTFTGAVADHHASLAEYSRHEVHFAIGTRGTVLTDGFDADVNFARELASHFDVIVVHYSVRLTIPDFICPAWAEVLSSFEGYKALYLQDEYENTECTRKWMEKLGFHALFSCVPEESWELVYPRSRFPKLEIQQVLTSYVPRWAEHEVPRKPLSERSRLIGYRGNKLGYWYGDLAREKFIIGERMKELSRSRGIKVDIEWDSEHRLYGNKWLDFLEDCRSTLGTESGASVFDDDGELKKQIINALHENPSLTYEEAHAKYLAHKDGIVKMNQASARIFEATAMGSALVLYEGYYSGVVEPDKHFIPLKKDFSNFDEVISRLNDLPELEKMTERAYEDVIRSGKWSFRHVIESFDEFLSQRVKPRASLPKMFTFSIGERSDGSQKLNALNNRQLILTNCALSCKNADESDRFFEGLFHWKGATGFEQLTEQKDRYVNEAVMLQGKVDYFVSELHAAQAALLEKDMQLKGEGKLIKEMGKWQRRCLDLELGIAQHSAAIDKLTSLSRSRWMCLGRILGLSKKAPILDRSAKESHYKKLRETLRSDRWLKFGTIIFGRLKILRDNYERVKRRENISVKADSASLAEEKAPSK